MVVTALDLSAAAARDATTFDDDAASSLVTLPAEFGVMRTYPRVASVQLAPQAAKTVPLTMDVPGNIIVFTFLRIRTSNGSTVVYRHISTFAYIHFSSFAQIDFDLLAYNYPVFY